MERDRFFTAEEAVAYGLADRILHVREDRTSATHGFGERGGDTARYEAEDVGRYRCGMPFVQLGAAGGARIAYDDAAATGRRSCPPARRLGRRRSIRCDAQAAALRDRARLITPTRSGYGASTPLAELAPGFHQRAAAETLAVLDALEIERAVLWGHSDGAVIAVHAALQAPDRVTGVVLEALHLIARQARLARVLHRHRRRPGVGRRARRGGAGGRARRRPLALACCR